MEGGSDEDKNENVSLRGFKNVETYRLAVGPKSRSPNFWLAPWPL
jgi:hypothetical protein